MAGGVDVNIGADTRDFARSVKSGMQDPVEDAQKALDEYVDAAGEGGQDLTRSFERQQKSTEELKRDIDQLNASIRDGSAPAYRKASDAGDQFTKRSTEGFDEIKESARSNAIEVGASFTGGFEQALGGLQGFLAEFLGGFGPAGVIAGIGAAALLGVITNAITKGQEAAEAQKAAVTALAGEYIELGKSGTRASDDVVASIKAMATSDGSDVVITLQKAWDAAHTAGADYQQLIEAIGSGNPREIGKARAAVEQLDGAHRRLADTSRSAARGAVVANERAATSVDTITSALDAAEKQARDAGRAQALAAKAGLSDLGLKAGLVKQLEDAYDDAADGASDFISEESGIFDVKGFLRSMRQRSKALEEYHDTLAQTTLDPAAVKYLESQGAVQAAAMLKGYKAASPAHQRELERIWTTAGTENATDYEGAIGKQLAGTTFKAPKIERPVILAPNTAALDSFLRTPRTYRMVIEGVTRSGTRVF